MINCIDQSKDYSNKELYQYLSGVNIPSFVKEAAVSDLKYAGVLTKSAFADQENRLFPINSKARVYVSNAFFINKRAELEKLQGKVHVEKTAEMLKLASRIFGIEEEVAEYNKIASERLNAAPKDRSIVFRIKTAKELSEIDLFAVKTAGDVTRQAKGFVDNINKYPFEWRRGIAEQFVKAAEVFGLDELPDLILKYAGQFYPDLNHVKQELARRMTKLSEEGKVRYQQLIDDVGNTSSKEEFFKLAECCYYTEKSAGLYDKAFYNKIIGDPVDQIFTLHFSKVASDTDVIEMGGEKFAAADLAGVPSDVYHQAFGFELDPKSAEAKDILPTMPKADVALFKQLSGISSI
jgi:hypothetical protein